MSLLLRQNDYECEEGSTLTVLDFGPGAIDGPPQRIGHTKIEPRPLSDHHPNQHQDQVQGYAEPVSDCPDLAHFEVAVPAHKFIQSLFSTGTEMCEIIEEIVWATYMPLYPK